MPRQKRIEFAGSIYHVMARGNRRDVIVEDEEDRKIFVQTLEEVLEQTGWEVFAWVLMSNHYHLVIKTPDANLVKGMTWFQNTLTKRFNGRHKKTGHLFSGRYKALLVEENEYLTTLIHYVHLNPIRAKLVTQGKGIESYQWSSFPDYVGTKRKRGKIVSVSKGLRHLQFPDTGVGRRRLLELTIEMAKAEGEMAAGEENLVLQMKRGWVYGSDDFLEKMSEKLKGVLSKKDAENGYTGRQMRDYGLLRADEILKAGLSHYGLKKEELERLKKGDWRKAVIASRIRRETTIHTDWLVDNLKMGSRSSVSVALRRLKSDKSRKEIAKFNA